MRKIMFGIIAVAMIIGFVGCDTMMSSTGEAYLTVRVGSNVSRAIGPDNYDNASIDHYVISATNGPGEDTSVDTSFESADMVLEAGDWTITVDAYNIDGVVIGSGSTLATLVSGSNTVAITVNPLEGEGTVTITLNYSGITVDALDFIFTSRSNATVEYEHSATLIGATSTTVSVSLPADTYILHIRITHDGATKTLGVEDEVNPGFLVDYVVRANRTTVDHEPKYNAGAVFSMTNNLDPVEYPRVAWANQPDQGGSISRAVVAPNSPSFFDWRGLDFAAMYGTETGEFAFTDISVPGILMLSTGILSGDLNFFSGHTVEITMFWQDDFGVYGEETTSLSYNTATGWVAPILTSSPMIASDGSGGYLAAFKQIAFFANGESDPYHVWTNPGL